MPSEQWKATHKSSVPPAAGSESAEAAPSGPTLVIERSKVLGVLEHDPDGSVYLTKMVLEQGLVLPDPNPGGASPPAGTWVTDVNKAAEDVVEEVVWKCPIIDVNKAAEDAPKESRLVTGIVLKPEETDAHKDIYSADVIREAAHDFLLNYNASTGIGYMHRGVRSSLQLVESWLAPVDLTIGGRKIKKGTWLMTVYVPDEEVWKEIKAGKITGLSIGGTAKVRKLQAA